MRSEIALLSLALLACQSPPTLGATCTRTADCSAPLVCGGGRCRSECAATRDCPPGSECLPLGGGVAACALTQDRCAADADCTAPLVCGADGRCRAACLSDADCTADGHCVLAGRLVCVASGPHTPSTCGANVNTRFQNGLEGWCIETSPDIDRSVVTVIDGGTDHHAARIDLANAPVGAWVRLYQEVPLVGADSVVFDRSSAAVDGATAILAIELVDASGLVLGRVARATAGDGASDCSETGRASAQCHVEAFVPNATMTPALVSATDYARVDLRRVAAMRRVIELARTGTGSAEVVLDDVDVYTAPCVFGWWRQGVHLASFDLDDPAAPPAGFSFADAPLRVFTLAECGQSLAFDGAQTLDWTGTLPPAYTVSFAWHATRTMESLEGLSFVHEIGGDMSLGVSANQVVLTACGQRIADAARLSGADARFQEMQVFVDRGAGRVCLARSGHLSGCMSASCAGTPTGLRFMELAHPIDGEMAIDEIRIDSGVALPDGVAAPSQRCSVDLACHEYMSLQVRDEGSNACVAPASCTAIYLCPEAARAADPSMCGVPGTVPCGIDPTCPLGLAPCDGSSCLALRPERCMQPIAQHCP